MSISATDITTVVLTMEAPYELLRDCISAALSQTAAVVVADNATRNLTGDLARVEAEFGGATFLRFDTNHGFAGGINRALAYVTTPYVLLLNNDAILGEGAAARMLSQLQADASLAGVAPKMVFYDDEFILDSVGLCVDSVGRARNRGLGQPDVGQYDAAEAVAGLCFGAALLRTQLFGPDAVGPLEERYFLYYEDVDWCLRAGALGWRFESCPDARVTHRHSFTTRASGLDFRYGFSERNLIWTTLRNVNTVRAWLASIQSLVSHSSCVLRGRPYPAASRKVIVDTLRSLPWLVAWRWRHQKRRSVDHDRIACICRESRVWFDTQTFGPVYAAGALQDAYSRLFARTGSLEARDLAVLAARLTSAGSQEIESALTGRSSDERGYWDRVLTQGEM